jgi:anti-anti-sigma regulatory factor
LRDEEEFPTVRFLKCNACGTVFTGSLTGETACPNCHAPGEAQIPAGGRFTMEIKDRHALFSISGTVHKIQELEELRAELKKIQTDDLHSLAFAFQNTSFLNSSMINLLIKTIQELTLQGKPTYLITNEASVLEGLQTMDLDRLVRIYPSVEKYRACLN